MQQRKELFEPGRAVLIMNLKNILLTVFVDFPPPDPLPRKFVRSGYSSHHIFDISSRLVCQKHSHYHIHSPHI